jgi:hypothetical protein
MMIVHYPPGAAPVGDKKTRMIRMRDMETVYPVSLLGFGIQQQQRARAGVFHVDFHSLLSSEYIMINMAYNNKGADEQRLVKQ